MDENFDPELLEILASVEGHVPAKPLPAKIVRDDNDDDDIASFLTTTGLKSEREVPDITKPWMQHHEFVLVRTPEEVDAIVEEALSCGRCSLDLETEGLDNRIEWDQQGRPRTVHQIVGFCIAVGDALKGYYIPVRHNPQDGSPDLNVKPVERVEAAIRRLCWAAQPTPKPGQSDPLAFREFETPPRVVIDFWHAKFDQEFLYPVTGIDFWHPDSFEDGMLAYFTLYTGDKSLSLKDKAKEVLRAPDGSPYEMIKLQELFPNRRKISFPSLSPDEPGVVKYAGSDAICTRLLCARVDLLPVINRDPRSRKFAYRLEKQVAQVVRVMERNRVRVDRAKLTEIRDKHRSVREEYRAKIIALAASKGFENFEPGSPKQLGDFLFGERGLNISPKPALNEKSGQFKTDYDSMTQLAEDLGSHAPEVFRWVMAYREEDKVLGTYLESLSTNPDKNDELRFNFKQTGAATGRFSAPAGDNDQGYSGIPIHGIPGSSDIRTSFVARPGYTMVKCDYAGQELRIVANLSNESVWIKEFLEGDGDLHSITARAFFNKQEVTKEERKMGKCVAPDTLVWVNQTLVPIRSLGFAQKPETFRKTRGQIWDGSEWQSLVATYQGGIKPLFHVVTEGGVLTCTANHLFLTREGAFVRAGALTVGTPVVCPVGPIAEDRPYPASDPPRNHEMAYLQGLFAAGLRDQDRQAVRIPAWILASGQTGIRHYVAGVLDIDGLVSPAGQFEWTTTNLEWAGQIGAALKAAGQTFQVGVLEPGSVTLRLTGGSSWALRQYLKSLPKMARLVDCPEPEAENTARVLAVWAAPEGICCDVTVEDSHVYVANGMVTHNTANFALVYGGGPASIMRATGCNKLEAQRRKQAFDKAVPQFANWVKGQHEKVKRDLGVYTAFGRWITIPDANIQKGQKDSNGRLLFDDDDVRSLRAACERHATNYPIQGCLQPHTVVLTDHGYSPIGELEQQGTQGLQVWTGTRWATFTARNMGPCQLADVLLSDGTHIECDTRHKLLVVREDGYHWVEYPDLQVNDRVATALCHPVDFVPASPLSAPESQAKARRHINIENESEFWYWMGRYMGDGWLDHERGLLTYAFGRHETAAIEKALSFWSRAGTKPVAKLTEKLLPSGNKGYVVKLDVWSVELTRWLKELGFGTADAHTKRLPPRLFSETLANRQTFMQGFMDSDGHKPPIVSAKGNPYNLHLCQRELLQDTKLLLRTIGVESCLRGPYDYVAKNGQTFTSYRLDIQRRMFERHVIGRNDIRHAKFHDMFAPNFLVQNLLAKGSWVASDFKGDQSLYVMYLRLKAGGKVSVYTLDRMCKSLGVTLDHPIYGFKRLTLKTARPEVTDTYTLSVHDPMQRFDAQGVITKNTGADIMKISMVLLHKEFYRRGWLRDQKDMVRMLLSVHDEIVFEVRNEVVFESIPVLTREMELPTGMAQPPFSAPWKVPLITDPLLGESWGAEYSCHRAKLGEMPKEGEFISHGFIYGKVPTALQPYIPVEGVVSFRTGPVEEQPASAPSQTPVSTREPISTRVPSDSQRGAVITLRLKVTTALSIAQVRGEVARHLAAKGPYLRLVDGFGNVLIDPNLGIRVNAQKFAEALLEKNLSDGRIAEEVLS